jgi:hypothetical protein
MSIYDIIPGLGYGLTTTIFGHPLDTIKTRLQSGMYNNTFECIKKSYKLEGFGSFYRGGAVPTLSHVVKRGYQFPIFDYLKNEHKLNPYLCGLICGSTGTIFGGPLQVIKVNVQSTTVGNSWDFMRQHYKLYGMKGFYKGFKINCLKDGLFASLYLGNYNLLSSYMNKTWYNNFLNAGLANMITWTFLIPFDYVKTQVQCHHDKNAFSILKDIHLKRQYGMLWSGLIPTWFRVFLVSGLSMMTYEFLKSLL